MEVEFDDMPCSEARRLRVECGFPEGEVGRVDVGRVDGVTLEATRQ